MPYDIETETTETKSGKPVKRVRFSDEVQNVYDFVGSNENGRSVSVEDETNRTFVNSSITSENSEYYAKETIKDDESTDGETVSDDIRSISNRDNELSGCYGEEANEIANSLTDDVISQNSDSSASDSKECNPFASNHDANDLDELINDTMHMTISPTDPASPLSHILSSGEPSLYSSSPEANSEKNTEAIVPDNEQKNDGTGSSRKRSLEGMLKGKQTAKLNTCLRKNKIYSEINSANELKNAVYNAWYKVKNEKMPDPSSQFIPEVKKINSSPKTTSNEAFEKWKKSKRKSKKMSPTKKLSHKTSEPISGKTKEEIEESKMAFRAWKKKKDELLRHQLAEKYRKEEKERLDALMNERIRKNDAESAYSAWNAHKSVVIKMEKKKNQWLQEKEKEKLEIKIKKNEEAEKIYYDWLRNKVYSSKNSTYKFIEDKPPWTPPGKANSLI